MAEPRICIVAHSHPEFSKGGGELAAWRQFEAMRAAGRDVRLVAASEVGTQYAGLRGIEPVTALGEDEYLYMFDGMAEDRLAWDDPFKRRVLVDFLAGLDCDVYHFHHYWRVGVDLIDDLMQARPEARFVMTMHEMLAICLHHGQMVKTRARELCRRESPMSCLACFPDQTLERFAYRKAMLLAVLSRFDSIVHPSEFIRDRYRAWGLTAPHDPVVENYLGDPLLALPRVAADAGAMAHRFGFFGQPTSFKGLDVLLRALPMALRTSPGILMTVFGAEREDALRLFPVLEPLVEECGASLTFAGRYDPADAVALMRSVGWVVVPSVWWENSPVVIQEARRAGTPLIVSDIGGMAEKVLPGIDGLHFKRAAPVDLAAVMLAATQPRLRADLGDSLRDVLGRAEFLRQLDDAYAARAPRREAILMPAGRA
ncbi:glycosyltransferase [Falsiroseomonas sp. HC035]|uniref:glycosyltransferase n=1 Tax=Falsiroseomonas sp. HC035 TaxID=3390999 RepID=UPI003D3175FE